MRKALGGGMRQSGILAAAGLYALDHTYPRLSQDHQHVQIIAKGTYTHEHVQMRPYSQMFVQYPHKRVLTGINVIFFSFSDVHKIMNVS